MEAAAIAQHEHPTADGLRGAAARGMKARAAWVRDGVVLSGAEFARLRGVSVQSLGAAVRRGDLFSVGVGAWRYYAASLVSISSADAAAVCRALHPLDEVEMLFFWLRKHGGLGARTAAETIAAGELERVVALAGATSAQARAELQH